LVNCGLKTTDSVVWNPGYANDDEWSLGAEAGEDRPDRAAMDVDVEPRRHVLVTTIASHRLGDMIDYTPATALVVVDVQNDFADPTGNLYVSGGEAVMAACNAEIIRALAAGSFVVYTQDWHPESTPHFERDGGVWPVHCVAGTWGAELHPRLVVAGPIVRKGSNGEDGYSGFTMRDPESGKTTSTELERLLVDREVGEVVVVGLAFDVCVKETALDARRLGHETAVIREASAAVEVHPGDARRAEAELAGAGIALT
jgi:nicotinamidase/pyrazinamidase